MAVRGIHTNNPAAATAGAVRIHAARGETSATFVELARTAGVSTSAIGFAMLHKADEVGRLAGLKVRAVRVGAIVRVGGAPHKHVSGGMVEWEDPEHWPAAGSS